MVARIGDSIGPRYSTSAEIKGIVVESKPKSGGIISGMTVINAPNGEFVSVDLTNVYTYPRWASVGNHLDEAGWVIDYPATGPKSRPVVISNLDERPICKFDVRDIVVPPGSTVDLTSFENYRVCPEISYDAFGFIKMDWLGVRSFYRADFGFYPDKTIHIWVDPRDKTIINWIEQSNIAYRENRAKDEAESAGRASRTSCKACKEDCVIQ